MQKNDQVRRSMRVGTLLFVCALALVIGLAGSGWTADATDDKYLEKARLDAEKAKADAEKAMAEAEKAMAEAQAVIDKTEAAKAKPEDDEDPMKKMVSAGYFPDDITLSDAEGKSTAVFSHKKHTSREKLKCIECHPKVFIMKVDDKVVKGGHLTMEEMKKGKYCGNCHNGHKAFSVTDVKSCRRCHPK